MKSILIIGAQNEGKSTTITEVCKILSPSTVFKLNMVDKKIETADVNSIFNHTFIIEVNGKFILVVAGAPTEQKATLKDLLGLCDQIDIKISFLLVAKRTREGKAGFDTLRDLNDFSELIHVENIIRVPPVDKIDAYSFKQDVDWKTRIDKISKLILENL